MSHKITLAIARKHATRLPMYVVTGFPRSGTTWLSEMIADYYNLPRPNHYYLPLAFASVVHTHAKASHRFKNTYFLVRDGRDAYVSWYFQAYKIMLQQPDARPVVKRRFGKLFKSAETIADHQQNLQRFIQYQANGKWNWARHTNQWLDVVEKSNGIQLLKYEDLLADTSKTLSTAIHRFNGHVDRNVLNDVVARHAFDEMSKRDESQHRTFMRKGKSGDWQQYFTKDTAIEFQDRMGDVLKRLDYITDEKWIGTCQN